MPPVNVPTSHGVSPWIWLAAVGLVVLGTTMGVVIPAWLRDRAAIDDIRENVSNDHDINLREEMDERHAEIIGLLSDVRLKITRVEHRTTRIGEETRDNREDLEQMRSTMYDAIHRANDVIAKHHPEER